MSRYPIAAKEPAYTVVVGWDNPLNTFFAQVSNNELDEDDPEADVLFAGWRDGEIQTIAALQAELKPYAVIPDEVITQLEQDHAAYSQWRESPLQQNMKALRQKIVASIPD